MKKEKVAIFGAGNCGRLIGSQLIKDSKIELIAFIDNDENKAGKIVNLDSIESSDDIYGGGSLCRANIYGGGGVMIYSSKQLLNLEFERVIIGTFTGLYEISAQLQSLGVPKEKIDTSYIEVSVKARENFVREFASEFLQNIESNATDSINTESSRQNYAIAEVGVYRGDFARVINEAFSKNRFYLFDTFEGFSMQDLGGNSNTKDGVMGANLGAKHFANTSVELVLSKMPNPKNCVIKKGWFPQSAQDCTNLDSKFCFVNLDCDLYEPILAGLKFFYPRMCEGGVILIHEYFSNGYVGVRAAVQEFFAKHNLKSFQKIPIGDNLSIAILKI